MSQWEPTLHEIIARHLTELDRNRFRIHRPIDGSDSEYVDHGSARLRLDAAIREAWHAGAAWALARQQPAPIVVPMPETDRRPPRMPVLPKPVWIEPPATSREPQ